MSEMPPPEDSNPFRSPSPEQEASSAGQPKSSTGIVDFRNIIVVWERLRLFYNGLLVVYVLAITFALRRQLLSAPDFWGVLLICAFVANVCFFIGPAIEGYARYFFGWHIILSILLFLAGLLFTALAASGMVVEY